MNPKQFQQRFFESLADPSGIRSIFDYLPGIYFFVKDRQRRLVTASAMILERLGMDNEADFIGKIDEEVYPKQLAAAYRADDEWVFQSAKPLVNRLEVWLDEDRRPDWCVTTKLPLFGKPLSDQQPAPVVGLMGISRRDLDREVLRPVNEATQAVDYLRTRLDRIVSAEELAKGIGTSVRTLNRKINETFGIPPYELMLRMRIQSAAESLLRSDEEICRIAVDHGFCDQSTFTQHFRKRMGMTPRQFRLAHR
ncbi:AraC family transcriptional regulator [Stieleria sp. JC731]|uniref:helix-turn-helix domain-containing protein n=1 Tax=Pirellulaceae TaxID=2691357 RepID=UPI001E55B2D3|nr:helix-turn-helix domain-containing protein [Stieleria sp. JC731]MCC9600208.1 AraC family transcriptional regulator [Stieleria sp. JC731]